MNRRFYACDLDFVLVEKYPFRIVAFLDFKKPFESITFAEVIGYNALSPVAPIYIVRSRDPENGPFSITRFICGDPKPDPPVVEELPIASCETWEEYGASEKDLRQLKIGAS